MLMLSWFLGLTFFVIPLTVFYPCMLRANVITVNGVSTLWSPYKRTFFYANILEEYSGRIHSHALAQAHSNHSLKELTFKTGGAERRTWNNGLLTHACSGVSMREGEKMNMAHIWYFSQEFFSTLAPANQKHHLSAPSVALCSFKCKPHGKKKEKKYNYWLLYGYWPFFWAELLNTTCYLFLTEDLIKVLNQSAKTLQVLLHACTNPQAKYFSPSAEKKERSHIKHCRLHLQQSSMETLYKQLCRESPLTGHNGRVPAHTWTPSTHLCHIESHWAPPLARVKEGEFRFTQGRSTVDWDL